MRMEYKLHHVGGLYFELTGDGGLNREYNIQFIDNKNGYSLYDVKLTPGTWARLNRKYLSDISIVIKHQDTIIKTINILDEIKGKRVFISFDSASLGDSVAWIPYCLEFKEKYECEVIVSTFKNFLFESAYPELTFVPRGTVVENIIGMFEIGWFYDDQREPTYPSIVPLQQTASNILHLEYKEIAPRIAFVPSERPIVNEYVCISTRSTSQCKHWYYWKELINWLKVQGYDVIEMSKEADDLGADKLEDTSLENVMNHLHHASIYIGLSSGISWLNWGIGKQTVMISNFTTADHEFQSNCTRVTNPNVCNGCWNNKNFKFDKGDWNWCPIHKDSPRQFECHKAISVETVIEKLKSLEI
jgi:hypothetical protein